MKSQGRKVQFFAIVALATFAVFGIIRTTRRDPTAPENAPIKEAVFQVDLLMQEASSPGKIIHARLNGEEVFTYTCTPEDAAVAVFTMRDVATGATWRLTFFAQQIPKGVNT